MLRVLFWLSLFVMTNLGQAYASDTKRLLSMCYETERGMKIRGESVILPNTPSAYLCWGFMEAIQDVVRMSSPTGEGMLGACPPADSKLADLLRIFTKYTRVHREELGLPAGAVAVKAIAEAFPCASGSSKHTRE